MFCCFTGHRPKQLTWGKNEAHSDCIKAKALIEEAINEAIKDGYTDFYCGMALGADTYFAECIIKIKKNGEDIRLHAAIPCPQQEESWSKENIKRYNEILCQCDSKTIINPIYTRTCMLSRNRFMVENSMRVIALWNGEFNGGTGYTVRYAQSKKRELCIIRSDELIMHKVNY